MSSSDTDRRHKCPEFGCGIKLRREELKAHLQLDHNRSEFRAERMLERSVDGVCRCEGVDERTRVVCSHDGEAYGPHPEASFDIQCCPYCGGNATGGGHRIDPDVGEVFCEEGGQSTWRYCPNCGDELGGET